MTKSKQHINWLWLVEICHSNWVSLNFFGVSQFYTSKNGMNKSNFYEIHNSNMTSGVCSSCGSTKYKRSDAIQVEDRLQFHSCSCQWLWHLYEENGVIASVYIDMVLVNAIQALNDMIFSTFNIIFHTF